VVREEDYAEEEDYTEEEDSGRDQGPAVQAVTVVLS
jgi:hypothetical protein